MQGPIGLIGPLFYIFTPTNLTQFIQILDSNLTHNLYSKNIPSSIDPLRSYQRGVV
jgi:hypothetical protein